MKHLSLFLLLAPMVAVAAIQDPVKTDAGQISGVAGKNPDVRVYKGIPFAAPPVGDLRWKPPQPVAHWEGVRRAIPSVRNACRAVVEAARVEAAGRGAGLLRGGAPRWSGT